jgi:hypothetical protein
MNNEPVAWMVTDKNTGVSYLQIQEPTRMDEITKKYSPLYTAGQLHPAKTLTDEDIEPLILKMPYEPSENELYEFAYDVLRKAQEK